MLSSVIDSTSPDTNNLVVPLIQQDLQATDTVMCGDVTGMYVCILVCRVLLCNAPAMCYWFSVSQVVCYMISAS